MPAEFDTLRKAIKAQIKKDNPNFSEDELESRSYAIATAQWKKSHGGKVPEGKKDWHIIEYVTPITVEVLTEAKGDSDSFFVTGSAINETVTRNNVKYTAEELRKSANSLINKPILKDHEAKIDNIIGKVREASYDESAKAIKFRGQIMEKKYQDMIKDGRLNNVSIGAMVEDITEEDFEDKKIKVAHGIEFLELSIVAVPGDSMATFSQALSESYEIKNTTDIVEEKVEEKSSDTEKNKMEADMKEAKIKELEEQVAKYNEEKKLALVESYKSLATKKQVKLVEGFEKLSEDALKLLISQITEIKEAEKKEERGIVKVEEKKNSLDEKYAYETKDNSIELWRKN